MPRGIKRVVVPILDEPINCARIREDELYKAELRFRAQTDLLWLGKELLGYDKLCEKYHRIVADHYVQKDPRKSIAEQDKRKKRLHLDPRGTFKSTLNMVDTIQWMLCFPDIAILLLSASTPLTKGFVGEVTRHFVLGRGATPSPFQELFPEYVIPPSAVKVGSYCVPSRCVNRKEDTLMSSSIESSLSGWHYDVIKEDDIQDNRNSETSQGIEKVKKNRHINKKMLMPWGYRDTAGTRYDAFDCYGDDIQNTRPGEIKVLVRPALTIDDGSRLTPDRFPEEDECRVVFPDLLSYEYLRNEYELDFSSFMTQYMNDALGGKEEVFPQQAVREAVLPDQAVPAMGEARIAWRFGASLPGFRYAGASVGRVHGARVYIIDNVRGIFTPTSIASRVVQLAKKHYTHRVEIEQTPGSMHLEKHIGNAMLEHHWHVDIEWLDWEQDEGARDVRLRSLEPLVTGRRLFFSESLPHLRELMTQLNAYGMVESTELIDTTARVADTMEVSVSLLASQQASDTRLEEMIERDRYDRLYGMGHRVVVGGEEDMEIVMVDDDGFEWEQADGYEIAPGLGV